MSRWIGLAEIRAKTRSDIIGEARGAYVAVVADAVNKQGFALLVESAFSDQSIILVSLDDVQLLSERECTHKIPDQLRDAIKQISPESPIAYGTVHRYAE